MGHYGRSVVSVILLDFLNLRGGGPCRQAISLATRGRVSTIPSGSKYPFLSRASASATTSPSPSTGSGWVHDVVSRYKLLLKKKKIFLMGKTFCNPFIGPRHGRHYILLVINFHHTLHISYGRQNIV